MDESKVPSTLSFGCCIVDGWSRSTSSKMKRLERCFQCHIANRLPASKKASLTKSPLRTPAYWPEWRRMRGAHDLQPLCLVSQINSTRLRVCISIGQLRLSGWAASLEVREDASRALQGPKAGIWRDMSSEYLQEPACHGHHLAASWSAGELEKRTMNDCQPCLATAAHREGGGEDHPAMPPGSS